MIFRGVAWSIPLSLLKVLMNFVDIPWAPNFSDIINKNLILSTRKLHGLL